MYVDDNDFRRGLGYAGTDLNPTYVHAVNPNERDTLDNVFDLAKKTTEQWVIGRVIKPFGSAINTYGKISDAGLDKGRALQDKHANDLIEQQNQLGIPVEEQYTFPNKDKLQKPWFWPY